MEVKIYGRILCWFWRNIWADQGGKRGRSKTENVSWYQPEASIRLQEKRGEAGKVVTREGNGSKAGELLEVTKNETNHARFRDSFWGRRKNLKGQRENQGEGRKVLGGMRRRGLLLVGGIGVIR